MEANLLECGNAPPLHKLHYNALEFCGLATCIYRQLHCLNVNPAKNLKKVWGHESLTLKLRQDPNVTSLVEPLSNEPYESDCSTDSFMWPPSKPYEDVILVESEETVFGWTPERHWLMLLDGPSEKGSPRRKLIFIDPGTEPRWCRGFVDVENYRQRPVGETIESIIPWKCYAKIESRERSRAQKRPL